VIGIQKIADNLWGIWVLPVFNTASKQSEYGSLVEALVLYPSCRTMGPCCQRAPSAISPRRFLRTNSERRMARWVGRRVHLGVFKGRLPGTASPGANRRFATLACFQGVLGVRGHKVPPDGDSKIFIYIGRGTTGYSCVRVATSPLRKVLVFRHRYFSNYVRPSISAAQPLRFFCSRAFEN